MQDISKPKKLLYRIVPKDPDILLPLRTANQMRACAEGVTPVNQRDAAAGVCQEQCILNCRISAAHDRNVQSLIKRAVVPPTTPHIWKPLSTAHNARINKHVHALDLVHTWAQLAAHMSLESLVILGDATLTAIARKPSLSGGRTADEIYQDFVRQVSELPKFNAKATCMIALEFIAPRVDSPMESETRITTTQYGLPRAVTNYTVPGATFSNGEPITLDLAWPEFRVAIEYDGDHHRTDKAQWRRDNDKRELLRHHHWIVLIATAANMADEPSQAELAYRAGRQLALRGAIFDFTLTATPLNELARRKRRKSTGAH